MKTPVKAYIIFVNNEKIYEGNDRLKAKELSKKYYSEESKNCDINLDSDKPGVIQFNFKIKKP